VRFDHRRRKWLVWDSQAWTHDADGAVHRFALEAARARYAAAADVDEIEERKREASWAIQSESRQKLDAALALAAATLPIADAGANWDSDPWLLGVANGVVDLRTGKQRPGRPEDRITRRVPLIHYEHAHCPRWEQFLAEVVGEQEDVDHIQRAVGYSLTGLTSEQAVFVLLGGGANGKSTFLDILRIVGGSYAFNMPFSTIEVNARSAIPNDLADLDGHRIVTASETAEGSRLNEARLKALTGGDPVTARHLFGEFFTFRPRGKFWLAVNHRPRVNDLSVAFWRRLRLIPFSRQFTENPDRDLAEKLKREAAGILTWAVRGCLEWQRRGLAAPVSVLDATADYRRESDPLGEFLEECAEVDELAVSTSAELFGAYLGWAKDQHLRERDTLSRTAFGRHLGGTFQKGKDTAGRAVYAGIRLRNSGGLGLDSVSDRRVDPSIHIPSIDNPLSRGNEKNPSNPPYPPVTIQGGGLA
jgi:putative DNA primase/helicase